MIFPLYGCNSMPSSGPLGCAWGDCDSTFFPDHVFHEWSNLSLCVAPRLVLSCEGDATRFEMSAPSELTGSRRLKALRYHSGSIRTVLYSSHLWLSSCDTICLICQFELGDIPMKPANHLQSPGGMLRHRLAVQPLHRTAARIDLIDCCQRLPGKGPHYF